jgi:hypothetical protein
VEGGGGGGLKLPDKVFTRVEEGLHSGIIIFLWKKTAVPRTP